MKADQCAEKYLTIILESCLVSFGPRPYPVMHTQMCEKNLCCIFIVLHVCYGGRPRNEAIVWSQLHFRTYPSIYKR